VTESDTLNALQGAMAMVSWGLVLVVLARTARERKIGPSLFAYRSRSRLLPALLALHTGLLVVVFRLPDYPVFPAAATLVMGMLLAWLAPGLGDRIFGENGLGHGWFAVRWDELGACRLEGTRFVFQYQGRWEQLEVPVEQRARLRLILSRQLGRVEQGE
jgi:hypothetical protein